jgi:hypothetical protein
MASFDKYEERGVKFIASRLSSILRVCMDLTETVLPKMRMVEP